MFTGVGCTCIIEHPFVFVKTFLRISPFSPKLPKAPIPLAQSKQFVDKFRHPSRGQPFKSLSAKKIRTMWCGRSRFYIGIHVHSRKGCVPVFLDFPTA